MAFGKSLGKTCRGMGTGRRRRLEAMVKKALVEPTPSRMDQVSMIECGCYPYADNGTTRADRNQPPKIYG
jgi:hypothetical protein